MWALLLGGPGLHACRRLAFLACLNLFLFRGKGWIEGEEERSVSSS